MFLLAISVIWITQLLCARIAIRFRTDKLTDLAYGWTFFLVVLGMYLRWSTQTFLHTILFILIALRSLRLALYLFLRVLALGKDKRFDGIREKKRSFAKFRILQWVVIFLLLIPVIRAFSDTSPVFARYTFFWIILVVWGVLLESIADRQKFRFKQQYPTRWCATWVRSKVQYPNYLGEILVWIGIYVVCLNSLEWSQVIIWLISPFTIIRLLLFVTGIPPLYRIHKKQRWDELERNIYTEKTPKILPYVY